MGVRGERARLASAGPRAPGMGTFAKHLCAECGEWGEGREAGEPHVDPAPQELHVGPSRGRKKKNGATPSILQQHGFEQLRSTYTPPPPDKYCPPFVSVGFTSRGSTSGG